MHSDLLRGGCSAKAIQPPRLLYFFYIFDLCTEILAVRTVVIESDYNFFASNDRVVV